MSKTHSRKLTTGPTMVRLTRPQGLPNGTTIGHATDAKTGNVYPVVIRSGTASPPMVIAPGTLRQNSRVATGTQGLPRGGPGVWYSPGSMSPPTALLTTTATASGASSGCATCDAIKESPWFPFLVIGGIVLVLILLSSASKE